MAERDDDDKKKKRSTARRRQAARQVRAGVAQAMALRPGSPQWMAEQARVNAQIDQGLADHDAYMGRERHRIDSFTPQTYGFRGDSPLAGMRPNYMNNPEALQAREQMGQEVAAAEQRARQFLAEPDRTGLAGRMAQLAGAGPPPPPPLPPGLNIPQRAQLNGLTRKLDEIAQINGDPARPELEYGNSASGPGRLQEQPWYDDYVAGARLAAQHNQRIAAGGPGEMIDLPAIHNVSDPQAALKYKLALRNAIEREHAREDPIHANLQARGLRKGMLREWEQTGVNPYMAEAQANLLAGGPVDAGQLALAGANAEQINAWANSQKTGKEGVDPETVKGELRLNKILDIGKGLRERHPDWTDEQINNEAIRQYEALNGGGAAGGATTADAGGVATIPGEKWKSATNAEELAQYLATDQTLSIDQAAAIFARQAMGQYGMSFDEANRIWYSRTGESLPGATWRNFKQGLGNFFNGGMGLPEGFGTMPAS